MKLETLFLYICILCTSLCKGMISDSLPKCDDLPPIIHYKWEQRAVLPPSWEGQPYKDSRDIISLLPECIAQYYLQDPSSISNKEFFTNFSTFLRNEFISIFRVIAPILNLCNEYHCALSPQTKQYVTQAFLHTVHGTAVDMQDSRLSHDSVRERNNKSFLVNQLPSVLKEIVMHTTIDPLYVGKLLDFVFESTSHKNNSTKKQIWLISRLIEHHNNHDRNWCLQSISPQTTVSIAHEYCTILDDKRPVTRSQYDAAAEERNFAALIQQFPKALQGTAHSKYFHIRELAFMAYWLQNFTEKRALGIDINYLPHHIKKILEKKMKRNPNTEEVNTTTQEFIYIFGAQNFGVQNYCYNKFKKCIRTELKDDIKKGLKTVIKENYNTLINSPENTIPNISTATEKLRKNLPACTVCFKLFRDQFRSPLGLTGGIQTYVLPCKHIFCHACTRKLQSPVCPTCNNTIESTVRVNKAT